MQLKFYPQLNIIKGLNYDSNTIARTLDFSYRRDLDSRHAQVA